MKVDAVKNVLDQRVGDDGQQHSVLETKHKLEQKTDTVTTVGIQIPDVRNIQVVELFLPDLS